jgi:hypothetical protein
VDLFLLFQGVYQKAQALYYQGDFELSLVFYHRGHKLRPELQEFRLGIQKAQEAIDNSVGGKCFIIPDNVECSDTYSQKVECSNPNLYTVFMTYSSQHGQCRMF